MPAHPPAAAFGVDVGGTGIKGAVVDPTTGRLISERIRLATPQPATPDAVSGAIGDLVGAGGFTGPTGVAFPSAIGGGVVLTAANLDDGWIGHRINEVVDPQLPGPGVYLNDADAATLAEVRYGAGRDRSGLVVMVTFGTGIGTGLVYDGRLIPNAELGHIQIDGQAAETRAAASARARDGLTWTEWAARASRYLATLENLLFPDLLILGGGISTNPEKWVPLLTARTPIQVARLGEDAGIIGAALAAHEAAAPNVARSPSVSTPVPA